MEFGIADFGASGIFTVIEFRLDLESVLSGRVGDQVDDDLVADEGATAPVLGDVAEQEGLGVRPIKNFVEGNTDR